MIQTIIKNIIFRLDSGYQIGSGHLMRCRNLAHKMLEMSNNEIKYNIYFFVQDLPGNLNDLLESDKIFNVVRLPPSNSIAITADSFTWLGSTQNEDVQKCIQNDPLAKDRCNSSGSFNVAVDLLVIDHYAIDIRWEEPIKDYFNVVKILVVDDLYNRRHCCDYLLDQTYYLNGLNPYLINNLTPSTCHFFLGPTYILLNSIFAEYHKKKKKINDKQLKRIQITFGGADLPNETYRVVSIIINNIKYFDGIHFDIILGKLYKHVHEIKELIRPYSTQFSIWINLEFKEICDLLLETDLCIGAGGVSVYERCCLGVPSVIISLAENQLQNAVNLAEIGALCYIGMSGFYSEEKFIKTLKLYMDTGDIMHNISKQSEIGFLLVDGLGCNRVVDTLIADNNNNII